MCLIYYGFCIQYVNVHANFWMVLDDINLFNMNYERKFNDQNVIYVNFLLFLILWKIG